MDCKECEERLYAFLDTELSPAELAAVRAHLDGCEDCGGEEIFEVRFLRQLRECCTSDIAPEELRRRVIAKLKGASPQGS
jgi:mycothiol system anti-sigma-R factor